MLTTAPKQSSIFNFIHSCGSNATICSSAWHILQYVDIILTMHLKMHILLTLQFAGADEWLGMLLLSIVIHDELSGTTLCG